MPQTNILDGKSIAATQLKEIKNQVVSDNPPHLCVVLVGNNPASEVYVQKKQATAESIGFKSSKISLDDATSTETLLKTIQQLNQDPSVHGILVQLPLPKTINTALILEAINPQKDVDGFHPYHQGRLAQGRPDIMPCTALGIMSLLQAYQHSVTGKIVTVIGTSTIVGMPTALALTHAKATVSLCHSATPSLEHYTQSSDIVISATGQAKLIQKQHIKPGAIVIDVGIHRLANGKLCGDVDFDEVCRVASWITPVPGGIGPMTIASLMHNTMQAYLQQKTHV